MLNPDDKELQMYDSFCEKLLSGKDIYNALNELFELNIKDSYNYDEIKSQVVNLINKKTGELWWKITKMMLR